MKINLYAALSTQDVNKLVKVVMTLRDMDRFQKCWSKDE
jgi:hypothetical protein